ncbi:MAG: O-Antigen ligase [Chlorobi bacterium]|nr:O-Antigen ligase [Chlorobiota bacterium]
MMVPAAGPYSRFDESLIPGWKGRIVLGALVLAIMACAVYITTMLPFDPGMVMIGLAGAGLSAYISWRYERFWVYFALLAHLAMMVDSTPDSIGSGEIAFAVIVLAGMGVWFFKEVVVHRRPIIRSGFDLLLFTFILLSSIVALVANILNDGDLLSYLKEMGIMLDLMFYFPLRKFLNTREDVVKVIIAFALLAMVNGGVAFAGYRQRIAEAVFQWEIGHSRSNLNEFTSMAFLIAMAAVFATARTLRTSIIALGGVAAGALFLVISFSRSPIVAGFVGTFTMMACIPFRQSRRVFVALGFSLVVGAAVGFLFFPQYVSMLGSSISTRLLSVAEASSDRSLNSRIVESQALLEDHIAVSPVIGDGYGVAFSFLDPLTSKTSRGTFSHNGYIWSMYKFGIPIALLLLGLMIYPLARLLMIAPRRQDGFERTVMAVCVGYMVCAFIVHLTSNLFTQVSSVFNFALCWALLDYVLRNSRFRTVLVRRRVVHELPAGTNPADGAA